MTRIGDGKASVLGALLLASTALVLCATDGMAKVGVTSATDGDPLGKPPTEAERVLRIGIDVQANELITTHARDRAHLVFLDGTALTVGPNASLTIDRFVYDPNTKTGDLAINASRGVLRLVGGKISKTKPITITTPSNTIGIRGGITLVDVQPNRTVSTFVFGKAMSVTAVGQTQVVTRPGSQVTTSLGAPPAPPALVPAGGYSGQLAQLEGGGQGAGGTGSRPGVTPGGAPANPAVVADQLAQSSGFSSQNSQQSPAANQPTPANVMAGSPAQNVSNANTVSNALTNANVDRQEVQAEQQQAQSAPAGPQQSPSAPPPSGPTDGPRTDSPGPTPSAAPSPPPTQVIVTRGRFAMDPRYTDFTPQTLGATPVPANNQPLQPTGTLANGTATISLADGRTFAVPWLPGSAPFALSLTHDTLGPLTGTGYVTPNGDFFVYRFVDANNKQLGFAGGTPTALSQFPTSGFATHMLTALGTDAAALPFASPTVASDPALKAAATVSPLYSVYSSQIAPAVGGPAPGNQSAGAMQATVAIAGQGAAQKSYIGVFIGDYFKDFNNGSIFNSGVYNGSYRLAADQPTGRLTSAAATFDVGGAHSVYGPNAETMLYSPSSVRSDIAVSDGIVTAASSSSTYQVSFDQPLTNLSGADYHVNTLATRTSASPSAANSRTSQNMSGYVGGIVEKRDASGGYSTRTVGTQGAFPANVLLQTNAAANRASASITVVNWDGAGASASFKLGGTTGARYATNVFIDDKTYALRDRPADLFGTQTASVTVGSGTSGGADVTARTTMVSYGAAPVANFFASQGVTPCTCEFMSWGWWSGEVRYGASSVYNPNGRERLNLATYVTGTVTPSIQLPNTGVATYVGHAIGNVQNGVNAYVAAGSYTNTWNFATQSGAVTIGNFDGATLSGTTNLITGAPASQFTGSVAGGGRTGSLNGSFFSSPTAPAQGQGGSFNINGPNYKAGGTFAAQKTAAGAH
ncbi:MAG: FecR domain-containing protein [Pseudomonadota bacterium]